MEPKPVRVAFADGSEDLGILANDNVVDLGEVGIQVHVNDLLIVDGELMTVVGTSFRRSSSCGSDTELVEETFFRLRLRPYPPPQKHVA